MSKEIWKDVVGYENLYQVSNFGRVKSLKRKVKSRHKILSKKKESILTNSLISGGYLRCFIFKNNTKTMFLIHRLVALNFIPNPKNKPEVNHIDGNPANNNLYNLEWCTKYENQLHAFKIGLSKCKQGEDWHTSKITNKDAIKIRKLYSTGFTQKEIGDRYNLDQSTISFIVRKLTFKFI